jgi:RNA 3'-terminal phosphate cyclase
LRRGYYPRGGGEVAVEVEPGRPQPLPLESLSGVWKVSGAAHVAHLPLSIAERMRAAALAALGSEARIDARVLRPGEAIGTGGAIALWAESGARVLGASRVAERGVRAEALGAAVGAELGADIASGSELDLRAADQVLVYLAMAREPSSFTARSLSSHARTAMWLIEQFLPARFAVAAEGGLTRVSVTPRL